MVRILCDVPLDESALRRLETLPAVSVQVLPPHKTSWTLPEELLPGMVLMVEPGAYDARMGGVRLEWMFLVTDSGSEVLSPYDVPQDLSASRT